MFYDSDERFLAGTVPVVLGALEAGEPALVAVGARKIELLQEELGADAEQVRFADMEALGHNPACIIPAWRQFVDEHVPASGQACGIGEPIWSGRSAVEVDECQRHESLLNVAFGGTSGWSLLCPYDVGGLDDEVLEAAAHSHPYLAGDHGASNENPQCQELHSSPDSFAGAFDPSPAGARVVGFDRDGLHELRRQVSEVGDEAGLSQARSADLVLAASELGANSVRHGGGRGTARLWSERGDVMVEVSDAGRIEQPLVGRVQPTPVQEGGRGLWMANQLCDLVRIRSGETGTAVRLHMSLS
jgi:anti-sigma regulatory factor (Ser/Thr protein kinase)